MNDFLIISAQWPTDKFKIRKKIGRDKDENDIWEEEDIELDPQELAQLQLGKHDKFGLELSGDKVCLTSDVGKVRKEKNAQGIEIYVDLEDI